MLDFFFVAYNPLGQIVWDLFAKYQKIIITLINLIGNDEVHFF